MVSMLDVKVWVGIGIKRRCQYFEKVNIPIEGIGMYGAEQQILEEREEEIKTELECQTESLTVWAQVCLSAGTGDSHSHSMQNMIENFLFIICGLISVFNNTEQNSHHIYIA